jgi:hypothetical protein
MMASHLGPFYFMREPPGMFAQLLKAHWVLQFAVAAMILLGRPAVAAAEEVAAPSDFGTAFLTPSEGNSRNSEGDFIRLRDGRIMFIYSHYYAGRGEDADPAYLAARYSTDGGRSWSDSSVQVVANEGKQNVMSVSLVRLASGEIALFYLRKNSPLDLRPVVRFSTDEAQSWSPPVEIVPESEMGYYVVNNDRVIQLDSGRLIVPAGQHVDNTATSFSAYAEAVCYLSDDKGRSWRRGRGAARVGREIKTGLQEPGVVPLNDGRLLMYCRTDAGRQYFCYSSDGGEAWSDPQPGALESPLAPASIERMPGSNKLLAIWNNNSTRGYHRTPLTAAISSDDGLHWTHVRNIESDPNGFYCYTAIEFVDDSVLLGYCAGDDGLSSGLLGTKLARAPRSWFDE